MNQRVSLTDVRRVPVAALAMTLLLGCGAPHVLLKGPPADAPLQERTDAYEVLRPVGTVEKTSVTVTRFSATTNQYLEYLQLNDGTRVVHPEDLSPVVTPESPTGKAIASRQQHLDEAARLSWIGLGTCTAVGSAVTAGGVALALTSPENERGVDS